MGRGSTCFDHKNIARIANAVQCHTYCQVTMIVIVSVVLKVLGGGRIPGVRIKWKQFRVWKAHNNNAILSKIFHQIFNE